MVAVTMIRVDPHELEGSAEVWRSCAGRLNEIGSTLAGCVVPPIPADLEAATVTLARAVDNALQRVADEFDRTASDLRRRAAVAATDLAAAASVAAPGSVGATANGSVVMLPVTSWELTSIFGAQAVVPITLRSTGLTSMPGAGGVIPITVSTSSGLTDILGANTVTMITVSTPGLTNVLGANTVTPIAVSTSSGLPTLPGAPGKLESQRMLVEAMVKAGWSDAVSSALVLPVLEHDAREKAYQLAPSRLTMENKLGHQLSMPEYFQLLPEAQPPTLNLDLPMVLR